MSGMLKPSKTKETKVLPTRHKSHFVEVYHVKVGFLPSYDDDNICNHASITDKSLCEKSSSSVSDPSTSKM